MKGKDMDAAQYRDAVLASQGPRYAVYSEPPYWVRLDGKPSPQLVASCEVDGEPGKSRVVSARYDGERGEWVHHDGPGSVRVAVIDLHAVRRAYMRNGQLWGSP